MSLLKGLLKRVYILRCISLTEAMKVYFLSFITATLIVADLLSDYEDLSNEGIVFHAVLTLTFLVQVVFLLRADYKSKFDTITGMTRRSHFLSMLENTLNDGTPKALIVFRVSKFEFVTETLGQEVGDALIRLIATKFRQSLLGAQCFARTGENEFSVLFELDEVSEDVLNTLGKKVLSAFDGKFVLNGYEVSVGINLGVSVCSVNAITLYELLRCAKVALTAAITEEVPYRIYTKSIDSQILSSLLLLGAADTALATGQFTLLYQPIKSLSLSTIPYTEVVLKWNHPTIGIIESKKFVPFFEKSKTLVDINKWVIQRSAMQFAEWHSKGVTVGLIIELYPVSLLSLDLPKIVSDSLANYNIPAHLLGFRIKEDTILSSSDAVTSCLALLDSLGVTLIASDYGKKFFTETSSFRHTPINSLRLYNDCVKSISTKTHNYNMVKSAISSAHFMGYQVFAEGVDDKDTYEILEHLGCDFVQGFYISRPISSSRITQKLIDRILTLT